MSGVIFSNGQRIYCPKLTTSEPPRGSEILVRNLPSDAFEDALLPMFSTVGEIYMIRIMMDFSGSSRGFGFIRYFSVYEAYNAVNKFNNYTIENRGRTIRLRVDISIDNRRLYIGNIPR